MLIWFRQSAYETRLKKWNFRKYSKGGHWRTLERVIETRAHEGKDTEVLFDGEPVEEKRLRKEIGRYRRCEDDDPSAYGVLIVVSFRLSLCYILFLEPEGREAECGTRC